MTDTNSKDRILKTAASLFAERGKHGVSIADIASGARVNKALIFYYYGSKDGLYSTVFKKWLKEFREMMDTRFSDTGPGLPIIETFVRAHVEFLSGHQNMLRIFIRELLADDGELSPLLKDFTEVLKAIRNDLLYVLSTARNRGEIRDIDPFQTLVNIISLDIFFFLGKPLVKMINPTINSEEFEKTRVDHVLDLLMNGLRKQRELQK